MAMVSEIRELKDLVFISLDGMRWLKLRKKHFAILPLELGAALDPDAYIDKQAQLQAEDCYEAALCILDQAAQTSGGLCDKLCNKGFVPPVAQSTVERLKENRLIDDHSYAERVVRSQMNHASGAYAIRRKLMSKQLPSEAIDAAMEAIDPEQQAEACKAATEKLIKKYAALPRREGMAKLSQALARRGFSWDAIRSATEDIAWDGEDWEDC